MEHYLLIREIVSFCLDYGIKLDEKEVERRIRLYLSKAEFIENLIGVIIARTKKDKNVDIKRTKELIIELEKIRLDLEFKDL